MASPTQHDRRDGPTCIGLDMYMARELSMPTGSVVVEAVAILHVVLIVFFVHGYVLVLIVFLCMVMY